VTSSDLWQTARGGIYFVKKKKRKFGCVLVPKNAEKVPSKKHGI
jgi:hypothetical protein